MSRAGRRWAVGHTAAEEELASRRWAEASGRSIEAAAGCTRNPEAVVAGSTAAEMLLVVA